MARQAAGGQWEWLRVACTAATGSALTWAAALVAVWAAGLEGGARTAALRQLAAAYVLGLRHALDADHVAAVENATRRLVALARPAHAAGLWFALGHGAVVLVCSLAVVYGGSDLAGWSRLGELVGASASTGFLVLIGSLNLGLLARRADWRWCRSARSALVAQEPETGAGVGAGAAEAPSQGWCSRRAPFGHAWQMSLVGASFALGLDTANEVVLLVGAAGSPSWQGVPRSMAVLLPLLFVSGLALVDALDGALMAELYAGMRGSWDTAATGLAVAAAFGVASLQVTGLVADAERGDSPLVGANQSSEVIGASLAAASFLLGLAGAISRLCGGAAGVDRKHDADSGAVALA
jgi:high-affinity nickel-transport protein